MSLDSESAAGPSIDFEHPGSGRIELHGEFDDEFVFGLIRKQRQFYESEVLLLLERIGLEEGLAVDAGAHIGNHTVFFAKVMGLRTIAIEPRPESLVILRKNVEANGLQEMVTVVAGALGSEPGRASLEQKVPGNTGSTKTRPDEFGPVEVSRIEDLVVEPVALIKVDVEGDEGAVLKGAERLLGSYHPLVVVEAHSGVALNAVEAVLAQFEYQPIAIVGRSDTYVYASTAPSAPIAFEKARIRASLYTDRRREQMVGTALGELSGQVRSVGLQLGRFDDLGNQLTNLEVTLSRVAEQLSVISETMSIRFTQRLDVIERELETRDRQLRRWQYEYKRVARSRGLRAIQKLRSLVAKTGLVDEIRILTPEEIEASAEDGG